MYFCDYTLLIDDGYDVTAVQRSLPLRRGACVFPGGATVRTSHDSTTKLYRCCSLESVSMAPHVLGEMDGDQKVIGIDHFKRNRGCNESFRAAVDRSYVKGRNAASSSK